jgi:hypothetical protein
LFILYFCREEVEVVVEEVVEVEGVKKEWVGRRVK